MADADLLTNPRPLIADNNGVCGGRLRVALNEYLDQRLLWVEEDPGVFVQRRLGARLSSYGDSLGDGVQRRDQRLCTSITLHLVSNVFYGFS